MTSKWWLKSCFRCGGDLHEESGLDGTDIVCLQCGHASTREEKTRLLIESTLGVVAVRTQEMVPSGSR